MQIRGECKTPGGKLAAVDLTLDVTTIVAADVSGNFFVHPEPQSNAVLQLLAKAIQGNPINIEPAALTARLRAAIPFGVELLGTSPEAIAVAVRRAIDGEDLRSAALPVERIGAFSESEIDRHTARWKELPWRLLPERALAPALNVALDEVLTQRVMAGDAPTLRFWRWSSPAVIVGRCQSIANEVDLEAAKSIGVQIVRRMTGGGAMFLQPHGAITYSLYIPESGLAGLTLRQSYEVCEAWVIRGLRSLGVDAHHVPINDIACGAGKIGGAAQARRGGVVLHHTTIAYDMNPGEMVRVLRIGREKLKDKAVTSAAKRVSPLVHQTGLAREAIVDHLFHAFRSAFGGTLSELSESELRDAETLVAEKYSHPEWMEQFG
jgi:lipoate-protein ligase A